MGFVPMLASLANYRSATAARDKKYFAVAPFGLIAARQDTFGPYEKPKPDQSNAFGINDVSTASIIPMYPSNGPIRVGSRAFSGFASATQLEPSLSCTAPSTNVQAKRFGGGRVTFNYGFYCPPQDGSYVRSWTAGTSNPGNDPSAWIVQSPQNSALDNNTGMTTGWLAGLVGVVGTGPSSQFTQLGDRSQTRLLKLMWLSTMERGRINPKDGLSDSDAARAADASKGPLRTDGIFYSSHAIFALARAFQDEYTGSSTQRSSTQGRWIHNGSVIAAELGFLVTGDYFNKGSIPNGRNQRFAVSNQNPLSFAPNPSDQLNTGPAMGVFFDARLAGLLGLQGGEVSLQRNFGFRQVTR
jgi:hypothetical protein